MNEHHKLDENEELKEIQEKLLALVQQDPERAVKVIIQMAKGAYVKILQILEEYEGLDNIVHRTSCFLYGRRNEILFPS